MTEAKGNVHQRLSAEILRKQGYTVQISKRTPRFVHGHWMSMENDFFNAFDIIATKFGEPVRWIQVTTINMVSERIKKVDPVPLDLAYNSVEIWGWKGGAKRKHKITGVMLDRQYFQVYHKRKGWKPEVIDKVRDDASNTIST